VAQSKNNMQEKERVEAEAISSELVVFVGDGVGATEGEDEGEVEVEALLEVVVG
jgi:hypothetical protein